jgi:arylsulfatase
MKQILRWCSLAVAVVLVAFALPAAAQQKKPNIVVIMGDDVGMWNLSTYHRGMMGGRTPNIDRIARDPARRGVPRLSSGRPRSVPAS